VIASSGTPVKNGSRSSGPVPMLRRMYSAVVYITWSDRMWPASWPRTVRSSSSSSVLTVPELSTTIGFLEPIAIALMNGIWAM
jgi:hypothetical protein